MSGCQRCDCTPCMCGKHAYPGTAAGEEYEKEVKEFNTHDPELQKYISDCIARDQ